MIPESLTNFYLASAGIGATLVGLIFVAVSIAPERTVQANAPIERQAMAASSFTALLNAFFISIGALIPSAIGYITLLMSTIGILNSSFLCWNLMKQLESWQNIIRRIFLVIVSFIIYGYEFYYGFLIIKTPDDAGNIYALAGILLAIYGIGLTRAWQLLGARRFGLGGWLSPLRELDETKSSKTKNESRGLGRTVHED